MKNLAPLYCLILYDNQRHYPLLEEECEIKKPQFHGSSYKIGEKWRKVKKRDEHSYVIQYFFLGTAIAGLGRNDTPVKQVTIL